MNVNGSGWSRRCLAGLLAMLAIFGGLSAFGARPEPVDGDRVTPETAVPNQLPERLAATPPWGPAGVAAAPALQAGLMVVGDDVSHVPLESEATSSEATFAGKLTVASSPWQVVVTENVIFVLDKSNHRIRIYNRSTLAWLGNFGAFGVGNGQFKQPEGLALDPRVGQNRLAVADSANHRVQTLTFDPVSGAIAWERTIGGTASGNGNGQFDRPQGLSVMPDTGDIFVADTFNNRVQIFNQAGGFLHQFSGTGDSMMLRPEGIAVDPDDGVFVADTGNNRILRFSVAGTPLDQFGTQGNAAGQFEEPVDVRIWHQTKPESEGGGTVRRLAVTDRLNTRVQLFLPDGTHLLNIGSAGTADGQLSLPSGAFPVRDSSLIYVADTLNQRIQWFDVQLADPPPPPLPSFPIVSLNFGLDPPLIGWEAVEGGEYRIERSLDLIADPVVWTPEGTFIAGPADDPIMIRPVPGVPPYAYFRIIRTQ